MNKFYIKNSYRFQLLVDMWEDTVKRYKQYVVHPVDSDMPKLSAMLSEKTEKALPLVDEKIIIEKLERFADLYKVEFQLSLKGDGSIMIDFAPYFHCVGKDMKEYTYDGVVE